MSDCIRGCTRARQHATDCEDQEVCRGCLPRSAEYGLLCETCHLRLSSSLAEVPGQYALLLATSTPSQELNVRPQPRYGRPDYWRTDSDAERFMYVTGNYAGAPQEGEPVRIACHDTAEALANLLAEWVESVCEAHAAIGPKVLASGYERDGGKRLVYRPANAYREVESYEWVDPPVRFEVGAAARWLRNNLSRLEELEPIGDMVEALNEVMGRAHALAPWREQSRRIGGIPCPECHRPTLRQYAGRDTVTCTTTWCKVEIAQERYLIWARIYEEEQAG